MILIGKQSGAILDRMFLSAIDIHYWSMCHMRGVRLIPVLAVSSLAACGGGDGGTTNPPPPATVSSISLSRSNALLKPTESATITATPKDASGNTVSGKT